MKINNLLEGITAASSPENATSPAPKFGRSDRFLEEKEEQVEECTTSGSVASVASPVGQMQRRGKGSIFAGIKTSDKYPNSKTVKESVNPQNFDSDVDYYDAVKKQGQQQFSGDWDVWDEIASLENQIKYTKSSALAHQLYKQIDQLKQQAGIEDDEDEYEKEYDADIRARKGMAEGEEMSTFAALKDWRVWDVHVFNNFYRGKYADYGPRLYSVVASSPEEARQVVIDNPDYVLQDLLSRKLQSGKRVLPRGSALPIEAKRVGKAEPGTISTMAFKKMLTPDGVQSFKFTNGKIVDGAHVQGGEEQDVAEDQLDEKSKSQAQFRTMAAVAHNPEFAKKVGISQKVGKEFHKADKGSDYSKLPSKVDEAELAEEMLANQLYRDLQIFKQGSNKDLSKKSKDREISNRPKDKDISPKKVANEDKDPCWDGYKQIGMKNKGGKKVPNCVPVKEEDVSEDWQKTNRKDKTDGMSPKAVKAYRRENPGSKLQTAVTKKPSELKAGSKDAKRRKSFCARMSGVEGPMKDEHGKPTPKAKALKRWNC